jgi:hypothetical protein
MENKASAGTMMRLRAYPPRPDRLAVMDESGGILIMFGDNKSRQQIAETLSAIGFVLHDDDAVTKAVAP